MGQQRKGREWRFELHNSLNTQAPARPASSFKRPSSIVAVDPQWQSVDVASICELLSHLPEALVRESCARERLAGASVQETVDRLLAMPIIESLPDKLGASSAEDAANVEVSAKTTTVCKAPASAGSSTLPVASGSATLVSWLVCLPDEIESMLFRRLGLLSVGQLGLSCAACRSLSRRWLSKVPEPVLLP